MTSRRLRTFIEIVGISFAYQIAIRITSFAVGLIPFVRGCESALAYCVVIVICLVLYRALSGSRAAFSAKAVIRTIPICLASTIFLVLLFKGFAQEAPSVSQAELNLASIVTLTLLAPFAEELVYRGIVIPRATTDFGGAVAVFFSAILFAVPHVAFPQAIIAFVSGLVFGFVFLRCRTIWLPFAMHALINASAIVVPPVDDSIICFAIGGVGVILCLCYLVIQSRKAAYDGGDTYE